MKNECIKVVMADDHLLLRNALATLINNSDTCKVVAEASNGKELMEAIMRPSQVDWMLGDK